VLINTILTLRASDPSPEQYVSNCSHVCFSRLKRDGGPRLSDLKVLAPSPQSASQKVPSSYSNGTLMVRLRATFTSLRNRSMVAQHRSYRFRKIECRDLSEVYCRDRSCTMQLRCTIVPVCPSIHEMASAFQIIRRFIHSTCV
jgi:hypothetical protein